MLAAFALLVVLTMRGDVPGVAAWWEVPALVLADQGSVAVANLAEVERVPLRLVVIG
jgi:hypothetical protein